MSKKIKSIKRYNRPFKPFNFGNAEVAETEYLESVTELDENGNTLIELKYSEDGEMEEKNSYRYNPDGKLLEHTLLYAVEDVTERRMLTRNEKGLLISEVKYYGDDSGEKTDYVYDDKDNLIERTYYDEEGVYVSKENFKYDDEGSLIEDIKYDANNAIEEHSTFKKIDDKTIEQIQHKPDGSLASRTLIKFDDNGKELSSEQTTSDGKLISGVTNVLDERGNVIERHFKDFYSKTIRYVYDEQNRCTMQELFDGNGTLIQKNMYAFDDEGNLVDTHTYEMDTTRGGRDKHFQTRYEYEFWS
jgi:YD repeat-containing protein